MLLGAVILGVGLLVGVLLVSQWFVNAKPADVARALKRGAVVLVLLVIVGLAATGRLGWALAALAALAPWAGRIFRLFLMGHMLRRMGLFGGPSGFHNAGGPFGFGMPGGGPGRPGQTSDVATAWLRMTLDHGSGTMTGTVLQGPYATRDLDSLEADERIDLWRLVQADPDSARIYEAWLDRADPDWRDHAAGAAGGGGTGAGGGTSDSGGPMSRGEALSILGLSDGASHDEIKAAYRRLMGLNHPDRGGTDWMAARINEARRVLIGD